MEKEGDLLNALELLGLKKMEARVYTNLLKYGKSSVIEISRRANVHRRSVYDNLYTLMRKGLVSQTTVKSTKYFEAEDPSKLGLVLHEKQMILEGILPSLTTMKKSNEEEVEVNFYTGEEIFKVIGSEVFKAGKPLYWIGGGGKEGVFMHRIAYNRVFAEKILNQIEIYSVQNLNTIKQGIERAQTRYFDPNKIRVLPDTYQSNQGVMICDNVVVIFIVTDYDIFGIKIKSKDSAQGFMNYFNILWEISGKIKDVAPEFLKSKVFLKDSKKK